MIAVSEYKLTLVLDEKEAKVLKDILSRDTTYTGYSQAFIKGIEDSRKAE
jgi:hypothetical protein